ncbi:MAG: cytochrome c maturation protein CcmE [Actinomycetota bacterium]
MTDLDLGRNVDQVRNPTDNTQTDSTPAEDEAEVAAEVATDTDRGLDLDLTPRQPAGPPVGGRTVRSRLRNWLMLGAIGAVLVFVLYQAITSARVYFYNVDEAIALREETGDQTIRMQGTVLEDQGVDEFGNLLFTMTFGGEVAQVIHSGDEPSNLFAEGEKVVAEGRWDGDVFLSHQVVIKHSEEYIEDNGDRLEYEVELPDNP